MFVLRFTDSGLADVKALPKNVRNALKKELLTKVSANPENCSEALHGPLAEFRSFHFGASGSKSRNVREGRMLRRDIARILTVIGEGRHA